MARQNAMRISKRTVDALTVESGDAVFWDRELTGFGVRVYATGRKVYVVQTRGPAGSLKRVAIGRDVEMTAETARRTAAEAIDRIRSGEDPFPAPPAPEATVADLAERYMKAHVKVNCRPGTVEIIPARGRPLHPAGTGRASDLGGRAVACVGPAFQDAGQAVPVEPDGRASWRKCSKLAEAWGMTPPRRNPCRSVRRYKEHRRERFLSPEEYRRLGRVLDEAEKSGGKFLPSGIAAIRLLVLTGCRKSEIVTLRWDDIDRTAGEIRLRDSKTGARRIPLTPAGGMGAGRHSPYRGQPLGHSGQEPGRPFEESRPDLAEAPATRRARQCAHPRRPPLLRVPGAGAWGIASDDREAARPSQSDDDGALRTPGARYGEGFRCEGRRPASALTS